MSINTFPFSYASEQMFNLFGGKNEEYDDQFSYYLVWGSAEKPHAMVRLRPSHQPIWVQDRRPQFKRIRPDFFSGSHALWEASGWRIRADLDKTRREYILREILCGLREFAGDRIAHVIFVAPLDIARVLRGRVSFAETLEESPYFISVWRPQLTDHYKIRQAFMEK